MGAWLSEALSQGVDSGIQWMTWRHPRDQFVCGYVHLPDGHPWRDDEPDVQVCGHDLTYMDNDGWIGFDTHHCGDWWPGGRNDEEIITRWTPEMVVEETIRLARAAAAVMIEGEQ